MSAEQAQRTEWVQQARRLLERTHFNLPRVFRLVWDASAGGSLIMGLLALLGGVIPPGLAWAQKLIIDDVVSYIGAGIGPVAGLRATLPVLGIVLGLALAGNIVMQGMALTEKHLRSRLQLHITTLIIRKALTLDLSYFEDAQYYDKLQNARQEADRRALDIVVQSFRLAQLLISFLAFALLLLRFSPWLALILAAGSLPGFAMQQKYSQLTFRLLTGQTPERRQMQYYQDLLTVDRNAKEVRLFGLGELLLGRYLGQYEGLYREDMRLAWKQSFASVAWSALGLVALFSAIAWIIYRAIEGSISFGDAVLYLGAIQQCHSVGQNLVAVALRLNENNLFVSNVFTFLALDARPRQPGGASPLDGPLQQGVEFRGVSFRYPGQTAWVLRDIHLSIQPGEKLALVGLNGAGKTTLVKLLTGLCAPVEGCILVDGIDLAEIDTASWRRKVGVIFQDYVQYQFSAAENIGMGQVEALEDRARIEGAAYKGSADEMIRGLPQGYETLLGRWFAGGQELSTGQWQKLALSRAFMRDCDILILDEPTASLDAEQEYHIFERFRELTDGKTAILISHRFSTVRMADRIAVIEEQGIREIGSHAELLALGGTYARLFETQARGYQ